MPRGHRSRGGGARSSPAPGLPLDPAAIDALYGLEPVFEPDSPAVGTGSTEFTTIECPYCWQHYETQVDLTAGSASYVEDCQVCCQPIELAVVVDDEGRLEAVGAQRMD